MEKPKSIVVVIPAHNEATVVGQIVARVPAEVDSIPIHTVVVDDGSQDGTAATAFSAGAVVVRHLTNLGVGSATRTGLRAADRWKPVVVVTIDADGQHDPADIPRLVQPILRENIDVVIGSRMTNPHGMPLHRIGANLLMNLVTFAVYGRIVPDSQSGFKAFSRHALESMSLSSDGYEVCSEIIGEIAVRGLSCRFVPVEAVYTEYSKAKGQHFLNGINVILQLFGRMLRRV